MTEGGCPRPALHSIRYPRLRLLYRTEPCTHGQPRHCCPGSERPASAQDIVISFGDHTVGVSLIERAPRLDLALLRLIDDAPDSLDVGAARGRHALAGINATSARRPQSQRHYYRLGWDFTNAAGERTTGIQLHIETTTDYYDGYSGSPVQSPDDVAVAVLVKRWNHV